VSAPGGLTALYDWPEEEANLVSMLPGAWQMHKAITFADGVLRMNCTAYSGVPWATQALILDPGWHVVRAAAKATGSTKGSARVMLKIDGAIGPSTDEIAGTTDWCVVERKFVQILARAACQVRVEAYRGPDGSFDFKDIEVHRLIEPAVQVFVRYPNYRGFLYDDQPQTIVLWAKVEPGGVAILEVTSQQQGVVYSLPMREGERLITIDASSWPVGSYSIIATASPDDGENFSYPPFLLRKIAASERLLPYIDHEGNLVTSRGKTFVIGAYDNGGFSAVESYYTPVLDRAQATGANTRLNYTQQSIGGAAFQALCRASDAKHMGHLQVWNRVFKYNSNWANLAAGGKAFADYDTEEDAWKAKAKDWGTTGPGFVGTYLADELPADRADDIFRLYRTMSKAMPAGVCFIANNSVYGATLYRDCTDVLDIHTYPIYITPEGELAPLEVSYHAVAGAIEAVQGSRPVWAVLQECELTAKGHYPTVDELRWLAWSSIIAGAQGILWWSIGTLGGGVGGAMPKETRAPLLARLAGINAEILEREAALLAPRVVATSSIPAVVVTASVVGGTGHLWAANITPTKVQATLGAESFQVTVDLPPYGVSLQTWPVDPVWHAAQEAAQALSAAGLIDGDDEGPVTHIVAEAFAGFRKEIA
jgi:hypothetical protein